MRLVKALMIGDIVGSFGLETLEARLPALIRDEEIDFVTVNGENAADGFGMIENDYKRIIAAGADVVTSGNHIWEKREFWTVLETERNMLRPANYPSPPENQCYSAQNAPGEEEPQFNKLPGTGLINIKKNGIDWLVINLQGREFMNAIDCPFQCLDRLLNLLEGRISYTHPLLSANGTSGDTTIILIDFHAESSCEKEALAYYADSRVSLFAGTHTHVQTADERLLPGGTAYITDLGMTGNTDSVIGMDPKICLERVNKQVLYHMEVAPVNGAAGQMQGVIAGIDVETGKAVYIKRI